MLFISLVLQVLPLPRSPLKQARLARASRAGCFVGRGGCGVAEDVSAGVALLCSAAAVV